MREKRKGIALLWDFGVQGASASSVSVPCQHATSEATNWTP
jgi:hypothetical protein